jgi:hypothetical protein
MVPSGPAKWNPRLNCHARQQGTLKTAKLQGESMKKIAATVALMCALSAYVSYPSVSVSGGAMPSLALSMQESRSLAIEAYDAV